MLSMVSLRSEPSSFVEYLSNLDHILREHIVLITKTIIMSQTTQHNKCGSQKSDSTKRYVQLQCQLRNVFPIVVVHSCFYGNASVNRYFVWENAAQCLSSYKCTTRTLWRTVIYLSLKKYTIDFFFHSL